MWSGCTLGLVLTGWPLRQVLMQSEPPPALGLRVPEGGLGSGGLSELPHLAQSPRSNPQQAHSVVLNIIFIVTKYT